MMGLNPSQIGILDQFLNIISVYNLLKATNIRVALEFPRMPRLARSPEDIGPGRAAAAARPQRLPWAWQPLAAPGKWSLQRNGQGGDPQVYKLVYTRL